MTLIYYDIDIFKSILLANINFLEHCIKKLRHSIVQLIWGSQNAQKNMNTNTENELIKKKHFHIDKTLLKSFFTKHYKWKSFQRSNFNGQITGS